ncbi:MAG: tRNA pseudouridine(38-40) synthase TruA [Sedimentisphaerales bacterium]|nr:tRNA pseudouridine(38-40) synthase TruA [Sedimentisphaerales bacterium]
MKRRKIKLTIQYDGADYCGWQIQPGEHTVQGELSAAVTDLVGWKTTVHGASRTDAGVSALGQSAVFEVVDCRIPTENFKKAINDRLPCDIAVIEVSDADDKFDVIGDAKSKLYRYTIYTGQTRPVLDIRHCWHIPAELNVEAMNKAAQFLVGEHDFKSFASAKDNREDSVRTIFRCEILTSLGPRPSSLDTGINKPNHELRVTSHDWLYIDAEGDGFLYNMVRNIVGSLVEVGVGRWKADKMKEVLEAKVRTAAGPIAPPQGLCLMWIKY